MPDPEAPPTGLLYIRVSREATGLMVTLTSKVDVRDRQAREVTVSSLDAAIAEVRAWFRAYLDGVR